MSKLGLLLFCAGLIHVAQLWSPASALEETQDGRECTRDYVQHSAASEVPDGWERHIVRFKGYHQLHDLHATVESQLQHQREWTIVPRLNPSTAYPSDFAVVAWPTSQVAVLSAALLSSPLVLDIHPDRTLRGLLTSSDHSDEPQDGSITSLSTGDGGHVQKKPGRLSTKWSFDSDQSLSDIVSDLKRDASVIQARRAAHESAQGTSDDEPLCKRAHCSDVRTEGTGDAAASPDRHLMPWGTLDSIDLEDSASWEVEGQRRKLLAGTTQVTAALGASKIWNQGFRGAGIRVGVFDTGIREGHPHIKNLKERSNWTHENTLSDELGHGTFVAGVIGGNGHECPGLAPEVLLHTFKVFTNDQVSFTSWFLDAFNYAIATKMQVVNLSIGGPDFLDRPFVDKVQEITASGIIMVSAIGNDGPLYGTLNNPADQLDVIGVGGLDYSDHIASFSSRGMSTWVLPTGFGGSKPDVMAYGREVRGSRIGGGCRSLSGTSVASPVVAGAVCLLASTVPEADRDSLLNPASMKQALVEGAVRLPGLNIFEQGAGKINLSASKNILQSYQPRASVLPGEVDFTNCPYMWPYCLQSFYAGAQPVIFNATIINGMGVWGNVSQPVWVPDDEGGRQLDVLFAYSQELWPWSGHLSIFVSVKGTGKEYAGPASGTVKLTVTSPPRKGSRVVQESKVEMKVRAAIIPTPPREKRVLWDQFHSIKYPPAYLPRDNLDIRSDILDWHGDHLLTNYHTLYTHLRDKGIYVEILSSPYTCFNGSEYGALIVADSEEEFYPEEVAKLAQDVESHGLGLLLFPEWYSLQSMTRMHFFDDNTRSWWIPVTGGSNIPAVNDLVAPFGLAFGGKVVHGTVNIGKSHVPYASGTQVIKAPVGARLLAATLQDRSDGQPAQHAKSASFNVLGLLQHGTGRVAVFGDASCVDANHAMENCHGLLHEMLLWSTGQEEPSWAPSLTTLDAALSIPDEMLPARPNPNRLEAVSYVLNHHNVTCFLNSASGVQQALQQAEQRKLEAEEVPNEKQVEDQQVASLAGGGERDTLREPEVPTTTTTTTTMQNPVARPAEVHHDYIVTGAVAMVLLAIVGTGVLMFIWKRGTNRPHRASLSKGLNDGLSPEPPKDSVHVSRRAAVAAGRQRR